MKPSVMQPVASSAPYDQVVCGEITGLHSLGSIVGYSDIDGAVSVVDGKVYTPLASNPL